MLARVSLNYDTRITGLLYLEVLFSAASHIASLLFVARIGALFNVWHPFFFSLV